MELIREWFVVLPAFIPVLTVIAVTTMLIWAVNRAVAPHFSATLENKLPQQLAVLVLVALGIVVAILVLPIEFETKSQLLSLFGLLLTAIIAFSSTTLVTNAMAGLMLRAMRNFHPGDFVRTGEHFGRVTEQGLFHTEIQTGNRDLTSIPNAFLVTHPVTVVRHSGTIIETTLSLGYDVAHARAEEQLIRAAEVTGLEDPFVQVLELGNHAITYRVAGFLAESKLLVSAGSQLRCAVLDTLHGAGIEIASPTLMNQRPLAPGSRLVPERQAAAPRRRAEARPEEIVFDKAEEAGRIGALRHELIDLGETMKALEKALGAADESERAALEMQLETSRRRAEDITKQLPEDDSV